MAAAAAADDGAAPPADDDDAGFWDAALENHYRRIPLPTTGRVSATNGQAPDTVGPVHCAARATTGVLRTQHGAALRLVPHRLPTDGGPSTASVEAGALVRRRTGL